MKYTYTLIIGLLSTITFSQSADILLSGTVSAENNQIKNVAEPTDGADAINKDYLLQVLDTTNISGNLQSVLDIGSFAELILNSENLYGIELNLTGGDDPELRYNGIRSIISGSEGRNSAVYAESNGESTNRNYGVWGVASGSQFINAGTLGTTLGTSGTYNYGVWGIARNGSTTSIGVNGIALADDPTNTGDLRGVYGSVFNQSAGINYGVTGVARGSTVLNIAGGFYAEGGEDTDIDYGDNWGVEARASNVNENGDNIGIRAQATNALTNYGIYSTAFGGTTNYAGYFVGDLKVIEGKIDSDVTLVNPPVEDMDAVNKSYLLELLEAYESQINNLQSQINNLQSQLNNLSAAEIPTDGLVAYYPFNGNANDESSFDNHGTVNGATLTTDRFGNNDRAYSFDGDGDSILSDYIIEPQSTVTFSFWAKTTEQTRRMTVMNQDCNGSENCDDTFALVLNKFLNSAVVCEYGHMDTSPQSFGYIGGSHYGTVNHEVANSGWQHYALIIGENNNYSYSNFKFYVNGVLSETGCDHNWGGWEYEYANISLAIGKGNSYTLEGDYLGEIDDVAIWNRALSDEEIANLYDL